MNQKKYIEKPIIFTIEQAAQLYIQLTKVLLFVLVIPFVLFHYQLFIHYFSTFKWIGFLQDLLLFVVAIIAGITAPAI